MSVRTTFKGALKALSARARYGDLTGVPVVGRPDLTSVVASSRSDGRAWKVTCPYLPAHYPGTGDAFTSVVTGALLQGDSLPVALDRAAQFILQGIRATFGYQCDNREGILLERYCPISICRFSRRPTSSFDWRLGSGYAKRPPVRRASAAVKVLWKSIPLSAGCSFLREISTCQSTAELPSSRRSS